MNKPSSQCFHPCKKYRPKGGHSFHYLPLQILVNKYRSTIWQLKKCSSENSRSTEQCFSFVLGNAIMATHRIINVNLSLSTVRNLECASQKVAGRSLSSNFTRTDSSVIKQIQKNRTLWQFRRVYSFLAAVKINLHQLIKWLTITSEVSVLLSVMIVHYPFTRYFWLLHSECGLCSRLPPSGHTRALRKQLPSSHRCSCK